MTTATIVTREARAVYTLREESGQVVDAGEADAVVTDEGLTVGSATVSFLDADGVTAADYRITLDLWPGGRLELAQLGRRFESFAAALADARNRARTHGLLAHGITAPAVFDGAVVEPGAERPAQALLYDTHLTLVPADGDPFQVPYGTMTACGLEGAGRVVCGTNAGRVRVGRLARQGDAFLAALEERRGALARRLAAAGGSSLFADGMGVPISEIRRFAQLRAACTAPERLESSAALLAAAHHEPRFGFVTLLDLEGEALAPPTPLPPNVAAFLLAPIGRLVVLELLAGPSAATYVFEGDLDAVNRDLQAIHFRRAPLALGDDEAVGSAGKYRLALRRLEPLRRLRAATRDRVIHNERWQECFERAVRG